MSQARKNLKIAAIVSLCLGLIFGALTLFAIIGFVGTTAQGTNGAIPEGFVDVGVGATGFLPLASIIIKAGESALGFWAGMTGVRGGNVPSQARAAFFANFVACLCFLAASAYFWWIDQGLIFGIGQELDTPGLLFSLVGALSTLVGVFFARFVYNESLDAI